MFSFHRDSFGYCFPVKNHPCCSMSLCLEVQPAEDHVASALAIRRSIIQNAGLASAAQYRLAASPWSFAIMHRLIRDPSDLEQSASTLSTPGHRAKLTPFLASGHSTKTLADPDPFPQLRFRPRLLFCPRSLSLFLPLLTSIRCRWKSISTRLWACIE